MQKVAPDEVHPHCFFPDLAWARWMPYLEIYIYIYIYIYIDQPDVNTICVTTFSQMTDAASKGRVCVSVEQLALVV